MCVQSYYLNTEYDLELDLLGEIKRLGIDKWKEMVERDREDAPRAEEQRRQTTNA